MQGSDKSKANKEAEWSAAETMKLHLDHVICCSHPHMRYGADKCVIGVKEVDFRNNVTEYVNNLMINQFRGAAVCLTWHWAPITIDTYNTLVQIYSDMNNTTKSRNDVVYPRGIILNPGLHGRS